ncbi:hypothetical protein M1563_00715 [Patescibacteria group bacterium]|nr:hypothetical protein [Patescibacteria group bacterium]MCL5410137.1 hypothetical protein [Patescibacteria group bacterium]
MDAAQKETVPIMSVTETNAELATLHKALEEPVSSLVGEQVPAANLQPGTASTPVDPKTVDVSLPWVNNHPDDGGDFAEVTADLANDKDVGISESRSWLDLLKTKYAQMKGAKLNK